MSIERALRIVLLILAIVLLWRLLAGDFDHFLAAPTL